MTKPKHPIICGQPSSSRGGAPCQLPVHREGVRCRWHGGAVNRARVCEVPGCERPCRGGGLCSTHLRRRSQQEPDWDRPIRVAQAAGRACVIHECGRPALYLVDGRRVCPAHRARYRRGMEDWDTPLEPAKAKSTGGGRRGLSVWLRPEAREALRTLSETRARSMSAVASELLEELLRQARRTADTQGAASAALDVHGWLQRPDAWEGI